MSNLAAFKAAAHSLLDFINMHAAVLAPPGRSQADYVSIMDALVAQHNAALDAAIKRIRKYTAVHPNDDYQAGWNEAVEEMCSALVGMKVKP